MAHRSPALHCKASARAVRSACPAQGDPMGCNPRRLLCPRDFPEKDTGRVTISSSRGSSRPRRRSRVPCTSCTGGQIPGLRDGESLGWSLQPWVVNAAKAGLEASVVHQTFEVCLPLGLGSPKRGEAVVNRDTRCPHSGVCSVRVYVCLWGCVGGKSEGHRAEK